MSAVLVKLQEEKKVVMRAEIWLVDLGEEGIGSEQIGVRPCLVCSNQVGNRFSPTVMVAPISSSTTKKPLPTHVYLQASKTRLQRDSIVFCEQIRTVDKLRLMNRITKLDDETMAIVDETIMTSFFMKGW